MIPVVHVPIAKAREICEIPNIVVHWRPIPDLPEDEQYATIASSNLTRIASASKTAQAAA